MFSKGNRGYSLVELLVVLFIATVISATVLYSVPDYIDRKNLESTVQELAIKIREIQVNANAGAPVGIDDYRDLGVHIEETPGGGDIIFFGDVEPGTANRYDPGEELMVFQKTGSVVLGDICTNITGQEGAVFENCYSDVDALKKIKAISITYPQNSLRPLIDGILESGLGAWSNGRYAKIELVNGDRMKVLYVWSNGQIAVDKIDYVYKPPPVPGGGGK